MAFEAHPGAGVGGLVLEAAEPVLGVIVTDDRGLVYSLSAGLGELGLDCSPERVGRHWTELFPGFRRLPARPTAALGSDDDFIVVVEPTRHALRVTRCPIVGAAAGGSFLVIRSVESREEGKGELCGLGTLGDLAAGVAHEINNPLTTISGWLQIFFAEAREDDPIREQFASIQEELDRIAQIVNKLLAFAQKPALGHEPVDVNELARSVVAFLEYQMRNANVRVETDLSPQIGRVSGNVSELKQVVLNLTINARQSMPNGGVLRISTRPGADGAFVELRVQDSGHGVPVEVRDQVFDAYFTTRAELGGTGLGLAVSRDIVCGMGGELELESTGETGSTFLARLPVAAKEPNGIEGRHAPHASLGGDSPW